MVRQLRIQFHGAIYHVVTRGDGRRRIFHDDGHYDRLTRGLKDGVTRSPLEGPFVLLDAKSHPPAGANT